MTEPPVSLTLDYSRDGIASPRNAVLVGVTVRWSPAEERWTWRLHREGEPVGAHVVGGGHWLLAGALADVARFAAAEERAE